MDGVIMRIMDIMLAFPSIILAIGIVAMRGPGLNNTILAVSIVNIPVYARVARASTLSIKEHEYVTAARAMGARAWRILMRAILPNGASPLVVQGTLGVAGDGEAGMSDDAHLDRGDPPGVPHLVLGHRLDVAVHPGEMRGGRDPEQRLKFLVGRGGERRIVAIQEVLGVLPSEKRPEQHR